MTRELSCTFRRESDNAVLVYDHATDEEIWFPFSQIESMHGRKPDGTGEGSIVVTDWIARQKGLT